MTLPDCPDPELLAACAEGRLHGEEREHVLRHLTSCHDCYAVFTEALHFLDESPAMAVVEGRVPATAGSDERALRSRAQPAKPSQAEPATLRGAAQPGAMPPPLGQPGAPETPKPAERPREPRDNVVPFDRRRWRRVATAALPLAAAAALTLVVLRRSPQPLTPPPVTVAQAPRSTPTPVAAQTPPAAPSPIRTSVPWQARLAYPLPGSVPAFGGNAAAPARLSTWLGVFLTDAEIALQRGPEPALEPLDRLVVLLKAAHADGTLLRHVQALRERVRHDEVPSFPDL